MAQESGHFFFSQDGGEPSRAPGTDCFYGAFELLMEDFPVEEEDGGEGLVLGGGSHSLLHSKVGEESFDFREAHF